MVLPDGTGSASDRPKTGRVAVFAVAALVVVLGFIVLGSLSPADPEATATSTTTTTTIEDLDPPVDPENFSIAQISTGDPLDWEVAQTVLTGHPIELLEHEGDFYLFATRVGNWQSASGGLIAWRSSDGVDWESLGQVIGVEFSVSAITDSPDGFVAAGSRTGGQDLIVWRSEDAIDWSATVVATEAESPYLVPHASAIGVAEGAVVVAGDLRLDLQSVIEDALSAEGIVVDLSEVMWTTQSTGEGGVELTVYGPLMIPETAITIPLTELDISDEERRLISSGLPPESDSSIWVVDDSGETTTSTVPIPNVTQIVTRGTGGVLALGQGGAGFPVGFSSTDGIEWSPTAENLTPLGAEDRETFIVGYIERPAPELLYSMLGGTWQTMGLADEFPPTTFWSATAFGGGESGAALAFVGRDQTDLGTVERGTTTVTNEDGSTLTVDYEQRLYMLEGPEGTVHVLEMSDMGSDTTGGLSVDLEEKEVVFTEPESGETLAAFAFEDLQRAETQLRAREVQAVFDPRHKGLVINTGALEWRVADMSQTMPEGTIVREVEMTSNRLVLVIDEIYYGPRDVPGFEIWTAELP